MRQSAIALLAVATIGFVLWWVSNSGGDPQAGIDDRAATTSPSPTVAGSQVETGENAVGNMETVGEVPTAPPPTVTPAPTPTPTPVPQAFTDLIGRPDLVNQMHSPLPDCSLHGGARSVAGTVSVQCIEHRESVEVQAVAPGRIVHINREPAVDVRHLLTGGVPVGRWSWTAQAAIGPHVVVDHGHLAGSRNMQTVYAGLDRVADDLLIGQTIELGTPVGVLANTTSASTDAAAGTSLVLEFSLWDGNVRQDGAVPVEPAPGIDIQRQVAAALGAVITSPTDPRCPLSLGSTQLPGAARGYRNGTHQGIDFGCGTSDRYGTAIADGTVVYLVDDYVDPTVADREALLAIAGTAGFTPHWTLVMLYGNVVVIDHGVVEGAGRVYTISAHLESVDPAIELGGTVVAGQRLGELGNRGTNASAEGRRGAQDPSLHLHWEIFVDRWYLGSGQAAADVQDLITSLLCQGAGTAGCPA